MQIFLTNYSPTVINLASRIKKKKKKIIHG